MKPTVDKVTVQNTEWKALVYFSHLVLGEKGFARSYGLKLDNIDWSKFETLTKNHSVLPLAFQGIQSWGEKEKILLEVFNELDNRRRQQSDHNMGHSRKMVHLNQGRHNF